MGEPLQDNYWYRYAYKRALEGLPPHVLHGAKEASQGAKAYRASYVAGEQERTEREQK